MPFAHQVGKSWFVAIGEESDHDWKEIVTKLSHPLRRHPPNPASCDTVVYVGFGRCYFCQHVITKSYLTSTETPNLTRTRLRLRKDLNEMNTARAQIPSQFYCLLDFQLSMFLEVHNKNVLLEFPQEPMIV